jgi:hypothetical protein
VNALELAQVPISISDDPPDRRAVWTECMGIVSHPVAYRAALLAAARCCARRAPAPAALEVLRADLLVAQLRAAGGSCPDPYSPAERAALLALHRPCPSTARLPAAQRAAAAGIWYALGGRLFWALRAAARSAASARGAAIDYGPARRYLARLATLEGTRP